MIFINQAAVDAGKVQASTSSPTVSRNNALQGVRYDANQKIYVNTGTPGANDRMYNGGLFDTNGALFVLPVDTEGVPASINYGDGFAFSSAGELLVTTASAVYYKSGWPMDQRGFVCMTIA